MVFRIRSVWRICSVLSLLATTAAAQTPTFSLEVVSHNDRDLSGDPVSSLTVAPGDILLGDRHGVLVIPAALAEEVVDAALKKTVAWYKGYAENPGKARDLLLSEIDAYDI